MLRMFRESWSKKEKKTAGRILLAAALLIAAYLLPLRGIWKLIAYLIPYAIAGWDVLREAARNIASGQVFDENFLMSVSTLGALALGEYPEAVFVMLFYQIGELFQQIAVSRSRRSIAALTDIRPDSACVIREDGSAEETDSEDVAVGQCIEVRPGERVPLDGEVLSGESDADTSALTGESVPVHIAEGDTLLSGCIVLTGVLRVRVTKSQEESTVSRILDMVESAAEKKAKSEKFITSFARWYTPAVVCAATLLAVVPPLFNGMWADWIHRALLFLVVSCPCALVISVPLGFFGGIGAASARGILIKGGNYMETLADCGTVVFDKTGTLTQGVFAVRGMSSENGFSKGELLRLAAHAEAYSTHPAARALRQAYGAEPDLSVTENVKEIAGGGVSAVVEGKCVLAGNARFLRENGVAVPENDAAGTNVYIAVNGVHAGCIRIADGVKPNAARAIALLRECGVENTVMLTGDSASAAAETARELGIDQVYAQLLPGDKVTYLEKLMEHSAGKTAFVGDGINDAPVLARADVGVAMGALGSDAAIEAADIVLMDDDPAKLAEAVRIARGTIRIVRQNIAFALAVKGAVLVLGAFGYAPMAAAVFADVGVAVLCILNSMRALRMGRHRVGPAV